MERSGCSGFCFRCLVVFGFEAEWSETSGARRESMIWSTGITGREGILGEDQDAVVDYSYVLGRQPGGARHDPHAHRQPQSPAADLNTIAELLRERSVTAPGHR
jgi:hypothetical protein